MTFLEKYKHQTSNDQNYTAKTKTFLQQCCQTLGDWLYQRFSLLEMKVSPRSDDNVVTTLQGDVVAALWQYNANVV